MRRAAAELGAPACAVVLLAGLSGCAALGGAPRGEAPFRDMAAQLRGEVPEGRPFCSTDFSLDEEGWVYRAGPQASRAGLLAGDRVLELDGAPFPDPATFFSRIFARPADASYALGIERDGVQQVVALPCYDGSEEMTLLLGALDAGADGRWMDCVDDARGFLELEGGQASTTLIAFQCARMVGDVALAADFGEAAALQAVDEGRYAHVGADQARDLARQLADWLRGSGYPERARRVDEAGERARAAAGAGGTGEASEDGRDAPGAP